MEGDESQDYLDLMEVVDPTAVWKKTKLRIIKSFEPHFNTTLVELMSYGHTFAGACGRLGIPLQTAKNWLKEYPDWLEAKTMGDQVRQYRLEVALNLKSTGRIHPQDKKDWERENPDTPLPNPSLQAIMFSLKTVHKDDYSEKIITETSESDTDAKKTEESLDAELSREFDTLQRSLVDDTNRVSKKKGARASKASKKQGRQK